MENSDSQWSQANITGNPVSWTLPVRLSSWFGTMAIDRVGDVDDNSGLGLWISNNESDLTQITIYANYFYSLELKRYSLGIFTVFTLGK